MNKDVPFQGRVNRGYCCRKHGQKYATKIQGSIAPYALIIKINFTIVVFVPGLVQIQGLNSCNINIICHIVLVDCCVFYLSYFTLPVELVLCLFSSRYIDHSL